MGLQPRPGPGPGRGRAREARGLRRTLGPRSFFLLETRQPGAAETTLAAPRPPAEGGGPEVSGPSERWKETACRRRSPHLWIRPCLRPASPGVSVSTHRAGPSLKPGWASLRPARGKGQRHLLQLQAIVLLDPLVPLLQLLLLQVADALLLQGLEGPSTCPLSTHASVPPSQAPPRGPLCHPLREPSGGFAGKGARPRGVTCLRPQRPDFLRRRSPLGVPRTSVTGPLRAASGTGRTCSSVQRGGGRPPRGLPSVAHGSAPPGTCQAAARRSPAGPARGAHALGRSNARCEQAGAGQRRKARVARRGTAVPVLTDLWDTAPHNKHSFPVSSPPGGRSGRRVCRPLPRGLRHHSCCPSRVPSPHFRMSAPPPTRLRGLFKDAPAPPPPHLRCLVWGHPLTPVPPPGLPSLSLGCHLRR